MPVFPIPQLISFRNVLFIIFIFLYLVNITQLYIVQQNNNKLEILVQESFASLDSKFLQQQLESNSNKELFLKSRLYKKSDEIVIDTSIVEDKNSKYIKNQYTQFYNRSKKPNYMIWLDCYYLGKIKISDCF
jgi:hypothetical protein